MPTSAGGVKGDGLKQYCVLPPIQTRPGKNHGVGANELPPERLATQRKLLRHRRSKDQQQELQKLMYDCFVFFLPKCPDEISYIEMQVSCLMTGSSAELEKNSTWLLFYVIGLTVQCKPTNIPNMPDPVPLSLWSPSSPPRYKDKLCFLNIPQLSSVKVCYYTDNCLFIP